MKKSILLVGVALSLFMMSSCEDSKYDDLYKTGKTIVSDFKSSTDDWTGEYVEYDTLQKDIMEFKLQRASLPTPLDTTKKSLKIEGHNRSDDMFMYLKKKVSGLDPNRTYKVTIEVEFATDSPANSVGIGGSPGSSVYMKAGASPTEPTKELEGSYYTVSIDKGQQAIGGIEMPLIGNVSNGVDDFVYKMVSRKNETPVLVKPNANGELWLCVGTDSGFEGKTILYYSKITAEIR